MEAPPQRIDAIDAAYSVESYRSVAQALFSRSVYKNEVLKATQLARHVLRHYLLLVRQDLHWLNSNSQFNQTGAHWGPRDFSRRLSWLGW